MGTKPKCHHVGWESDTCLAQEQIDEEKKRWEVGVGFGFEGFKLWVAREIDRMGRLKRSTEKTGRFSFLKKGKNDSEDPNYRELRNEFRVFLTGVRDNVNLYLWFALSALADRNTDRKYEAKVYHLFGDVTSTILLIQQNFDPSLVTPDLLSFLKDRITRIGSPGAYDLMGHASTITQGDGEKRFMDSASTLERMLTEIRQEISKYFKRDEEFEAEVAEAMKNR
jgi:hypothetical protein